MHSTDNFAHSSSEVVAVLAVSISYEQQRHALRAVYMLDKQIDNSLGIIVVMAQIVSS